MSQIAIARTSSYLAQRAADYDLYLHQRGRKDEGQRENANAWRAMSHGVRMVACLAANMHKDRALHEFETFNQSERRKISGALGSLVSELSTIKKMMALPV